MPRTKVEPEVVTRIELRELAEWEAKLSKAKHDVSEAEKQLKPRRMQLVKKVLGISTEESLRAMDPEQVNRLLLSRLDKNLWKHGYGAPDFSLEKTWEGRPTAWKELYIEEAGEIEAAKASADTPKQFSYRVEVRA